MNLIDLENLSGLHYLFWGADKDYEDEWNYDQQELNSLQIKIEKQQVESLKVLDVMAFGIIGFIALITLDLTEPTSLTIACFSK